MKLVALALASGHIADERPVSLLLVSQRPESGKTEIVKKFNRTSGVDFSNDISAFGIRRDLYKKIVDGSIRHIVIPELLAPLSKKTSADALIGQLQTIMEDGTMNVHVGFTPEIQTDSNRSVGIIACMPRTQYLAHHTRWVLSGFLSRFLVISYQYDELTVENIFDSITTGEYAKNEDTPLTFPAKDTYINMPNEIAIKCVQLAKDITLEARTKGSTYGFREAKFMNRMVKANVLLDNVLNGSKRRAAVDADFEMFRGLTYLINEQYNEVRS